MEVKKTRSSGEQDRGGLRAEEEVEAEKGGEEVMEDWKYW